MTTGEALCMQHTLLVSAKPAAHHNGGDQNAMLLYPPELSADSVKVTLGPESLLTSYGCLQQACDSSAGRNGTE